MPSPPRVEVSSGALRWLATGHAIAACGAVVLATGNEGAVAAVAVTVGALIVALVAGRAASVLVRHPAAAPLGAAIAGTGCVLLAVTPRGAITLPIAAVLGAGIGIAAPLGQRREMDAARVAFGFGLGVVELAVVALAGGRIAALWWTALLAVALAGITLLTGERSALGRTGVAVAVVSALLAGGLVAWVGANDPTVQWFGRVFTHGDPSQRRVALTFDDGPDDPYTLEVSAILSQRGVQGTFFEVGKAVDARPDITRSLVAAGHLVANHSYHHDYWRWLDPRYPELDRTEAAFRKAIGVCPAFFRPPHGQRTPFMLAQVRDRGMHAVTWDDSAQDWSDRDGVAVARRIVDRAQPGSIILLHDGLDGNVTADRSVLRTALPLIVDGLRAKGLEPVRLDQLLGLPGYLDRC